MDAELGVATSEYPAPPPTELVTTTTDFAEEDPFVAVIVAVPAPTAVTSPVALTVATEGVSDWYVVPTAVVRSWSVPLERSASNFSWVVAPRELRPNEGGLKITPVTVKGGIFSVSTELTVKLPFFAFMVAVDIPIVVPVAVTIPFESTVATVVSVELYVVFTS
jgi:hypothetical protein